MAFVRFIVPYRDKRSTHRSGVFQAAFDLADAGLLTGYEEQHLHEIGLWFDQNLSKPDRFSRKRNSYHRDARGISWFKDSATDHILRVREIIVLLENHGVHVKQISSERPGYVVYEDEFQVVAEPFADTSR